MNRALKITFIILLTFTFSHWGQIKIHKHLTTENGLINNSVIRIIQDSKGYMWFSTLDGISIWDGNNFTNLTKKNGLTSPAVIDLIEAPDSSIYLSCYGKGIIIYKDGVKDTLNTEDGLLNNTVIRLRLLNDNPVFISREAQHYIDGKLINVDTLKGKLKTFTGDVLIDNKNVFVSGRHGGLYVKDKFVDKVFTEKDGLHSTKVDLIEKDKFGNILIATSNGPNKYKDGKVTSLYHNGKIIKGMSISDIVAGSDGINYYGGATGLIIEENGKTEILTTKNGLLQNNIFSLEEDRNGNIYIGYEKSGLSIYQPKKITNFVSDNERKEFNANSFLQNNKSEIIFGTNKGVSNILPNGKLKLLSKNNLTDFQITCLSKTENDEILIGTNNGFNILTKGVVQKFPTSRKTFFKGVQSVAVSPEGDIIYARRRVGLVIFTPDYQKERNFLKSFYASDNLHSQDQLQGTEHFVKNSDGIKREKINNGVLTYITTNNGLRNSWVLTLSFAKDSTLVIGNHGNGVSFYKDGSFKHISKKDGLTGGIINATLEHSSGSFWFGTEGNGINIYNGKTIDTIDVRHGLSSNNISGIVQIEDRVFVTTQNGLNIIRRTGDEYFIRQIKNTDGLVSNACNRNALLVDDKNKLWIGTNKGISKFDPAADRVNSNPPSIYFKGLEIFNEEYSFQKFTENPNLNYDQNYLKFKFSGINLSAPEQIIYKYKLSGVDKDWVRTNESAAQYTSLDDGSYNFEIKARNEWGYWSEPKTLSFVINPAWWETWWFYALSILALGSLIAFVSSYRFRHLLAIEKMRSKISADLHDSIGSGLSEISILTELLGAQVPEDKKEFKSGLSNVSTISRSLIESMSDIVWLVNPKKDTLKDLFKRLQMSYHEVLKYSDIDLYVENLDELETVKLPMNFRQHLYLIFKEAINNAIKYSGGDLLNLKIQTAGNNLTVIFSDNGIGFDQNKDKMGNGLINMKNRAKEIGGSIDYFSVANKGTTIKFTGKFSKQKI